MSWFTRSIRPPETPNDNDPATTGAPGTVGPPEARAGDPHGLVAEGPVAFDVPPPTITPSVWSGWPADWNTPSWYGHRASLTDIAWACLDLNASLLATMPPYLVDAAPSLDAEWLTNPDPEIYTSWEEFAKQLFWDYQGVGEVFVWALSRYASGWPARFRVIPPWMVNVEMRDGRRQYGIGSLDVTADMLHIRYSSTISDAHGHGPLEAGQAKLVAAEIFQRYGTSFAANGGIPTSILEYADRKLTREESRELQAEWVQARIASIGEPAVLSGGVTWRAAVQVNPKDMALSELQEKAEARIAVLLGVPPRLVGLPSGGDPMTYANVTMIYDHHWRAGLRPRAQAVMSALSGWLVPRGTRVEVNRDAYVQPEPLVRAQTAQIYNAIRDETGKPVMTVEDIQDAERLTNSTPGVFG